MVSAHNFPSTDAFINRTLWTGLYLPWSHFSLLWCSAPLGQKLLALVAVVMVLVSQFLLVLSESLGLNGIKINERRKIYGPPSSSDRFLNLTYRLYTLKLLGM